ncbi:TRAP transporter small permease subunit [Desulfosoma sp.]|uniref:TRAP transporter small permease subunit n=1 Tax=Desulfosoma sp. TaxID=2603217 RepID=UPI004049B66B
MLETFFNKTTLMEKILRSANKVSEWAALISSAAMLLIVLLILLEVFVRSIYDTSTMITDEYSAYFYVVLVFFGLGYTLATDGHIRVKILLSRLNERGQALVDLCATTLALGLTGFALKFSLSLVREAYELRMVSETPAQTPMWIPQAAIPLGLVLFMGQLLAHGCSAYARWKASRPCP